MILLLRKKRKTEESQKHTSVFSFATKHIATDFRNSKNNQATVVSSEALSSSPNFLKNVVMVEKRRMNQSMSTCTAPGRFSIAAAPFGNIFTALFYTKMPPLSNRVLFIFCRIHKKIGRKSKKLRKFSFFIFLFLSICIIL